MKIKIRHFYQEVFIDLSQDLICLFDKIMKKNTTRPKKFEKLNYWTEIVMAIEKKMI